MKKKEHEQQKDTKRYFCKQPDQPSRSTALHHVLVTSSASAALPIPPTWITKLCTVAFFAHDFCIWKNTSKVATTAGERRPSLFPLLDAACKRVAKESLCMHSTAMHWKTSWKDIHENEMQKHLKFIQNVSTYRVKLNLIVIQRCKWHFVNISKFLNIGFPEPQAWNLAPETSSSAPAGSGYWGTCIDGFNQYWSYIELF